MIMNMPGIEYLPAVKQAELSNIITLIKEVVAAEMIVLFGSYARNDWVEEKYDEEHYRYQSDFDILVIVETKSASAQNRIELEIEERIEQAGTIKTPVSVIVHDIYFVNQKLAKAQYFFTDIKKEGVILEDSGRHQLKESKPLNAKERLQLAQKDFDYWFSNAEEFFIDFKNAFDRASYRNAAFMLHQVAERLYSGILLVFTRYKPNTHDLAALRMLAHSVDSRLDCIFPLNTAENRRLFRLLKKAYIDARYNPLYTITEEKLSQLSQQVEKLKEIGRLICAEKMNQFRSF
jgi:predicted nucleotidyltransferase/HEPN domain-containing protein